MCELIYCNALAFIAGFVLDTIFGEPPHAFHPVVWIGWLITRFEDFFYRFNNKLLSGFLFVLLVSAIVGSVSCLIFFVFFRFGEVGRVVYCVGASYVVFSSVSIRSLKEHALGVRKALIKGDLDEARKRLSFMVSRDTSGMKQDKIITSTIESVAENFVDGILSPMIYYTLFGIVGVVIFKTVSTFDSMIGYLNDRYRFFGRFAARLDDVVNFIPARLSVLFIGFASLLLRLDVSSAIKTFAKYRKAHKSPNSAHPMSAFAGALNIRLGGLTRYDGVLVEKPYIGESTRVPEVKDIDRAINLLSFSSLLAFMFCFSFFVMGVLCCRFFIGRL